MRHSQKRVVSLAVLLAAALFLFPAFPAGAESSPTATPLAAPTLTFIGHASMKIKTAEGVVIYIDPYYEGDYSEKADIILVTHEHSDHNKIKLCTQNEGCVVLRVKETINKDLTYNTFEYFGVKIEPVPAENKNHPIKSSTGFVLTFDGIVLYHAGDTSLIPQMADLAAKNIDYAFFPIDGRYNMDAAEAMECAAMVGAKHNTPIHFFSASPEDFKPENVLHIAYGETITLAPAEDTAGGV
jgi:L-ascorbate metabolism protein UlaG (beta-lactamase superfamily)